MIAQDVDSFEPGAHESRVHSNPGHTPNPPAVPVRRTSAARVSPSRQRSVSRVIHLASGGLIATYIYAPAPVAGGLQPVLAYVVVPAVTITGVFIWKQAQLRKLAKKIARR